MSDATVRGIVHVIEETKTFGQNNFRKRLVVLEQPSERFTNYIPVDFLRDACDSVDELNIGDEIEVSYRLSGRKWQRDPSSEVKFFLNAEASRFTVLNKKGDSGGGDAGGGTPASAPPDDPGFNDDEAPF